MVWQSSVVGGRGPLSAQTFWPIETVPFAGIISRSTWSGIEGEEARTKLSTHVRGRSRDSEGGTSCSLALVHGRSAGKLRNLDSLSPNFNGGSRHRRSPSAESRVASYEDTLISHKHKCGLSSRALTEKRGIARRSNSNCSEKGSEGGLHRDV